MQKQNETKMLLSLIPVLLSFGALATIIFPWLNYDQNKVFGIYAIFGHGEIKFNIFALLLMVFILLSFILNFLLIKTYQNILYYVVFGLNILIVILACLMPLIFKTLNSSLIYESLNMGLGLIMNIIIFVLNDIMLGFCIVKMRRGDF